MRNRLPAMLCVALSSPACLVESVCSTSADCPRGEICSPTGHCAKPQSSLGGCLVDDDCGAGLRCVGVLCEAGASESSEVAAAPGSCPSDMVRVDRAYCIDRWEASRPDASATRSGNDTSLATSRPSVLPWLVADNATAAAACRAAGKVLCTAAQWQLACEGSEGLSYGYGEAYEATTCNGIDSFGRSGFHVEVTGSFPGCQSEWGAYDLNGNVWEHVRDGDGRTVRGGAYNCSDSQALHRCDYIPTTWTPSALGFRCCRELG